MQHSGMVEEANYAFFLNTRIFQDICLAAERMHRAAAAFFCTLKASPAARSWIHWQVSRPETLTPHLFQGREIWQLP